MAETLTIISTQMQLVNAIEYLSSTKGELYNHLIICTSTRRRKKQLSSLLDKPYYAKVFQKVDYLRYGGGSRIKSYWVTLCLKYGISRIIKKATAFDLIIIGNYLSIIHRYVQYLCWKKNEDLKFIVVDDGTATTEAVVIREKEKHDNKLVYYGRSKYLVKIFLTKFSSFKFFVPHSLTFFSIYDKLNYSNDDTFVKCDYVYLKNQVNRFIAREELGLVIIGQPLIAEGFLSKDRYNQSITDYLINHYGDKKGKVVYVPHPIEKVDESLSETLKESVLIVRPDVPFEMWALCTEIKSVVGFYSSALVNLRYFLPTIPIVSLCPSEIINSKEYDCQEAIQAYKYFFEIGIDIIHI